MALRKEVKAVVKERDKNHAREMEQLYKDMVTVLAPLAFKHAVPYVIALAQMVNRDKFGHGKQRLNDFADAVVFHHEALVEGRATYEEVGKEVFAVTGRIYDYSETEMINEMIEKALALKEARNAKR